MRVNPWYLLLGLITASLIYTLTLMIEPYEEVVDLGWSEAAQRNPFLAAEQFLSDLDMTVESSDRLDVLTQLTPDSTLVITNANHVLSKQRADDLVQWIEEGGHVVVAAQLYNEAQPDVLLSRFDIEKYPVDDGFLDNYGESGDDLDSPNQDSSSEDSSGEDITEDSSPEDSSSEEKALRELLQEASEQARDELEKNRARKEALQQDWDQAQATRKREAFSIADNIVLLSFEEIDYRIQADFSGSGSLSHPAMGLEEGEDYPDYQPFYWAGNEKAVGFMQMQVGAGLLTVMADVNIWTSSQIDVFDHAFLLEFITGSSDKVVFLYGAVVPGLFELIWQHFPELTIALLMLLTAWVFYRMRRFGPLIRIGGDERRSFKEHIHAVGRLLWRQNMGDQLLDGVRQDIWKNLQRRHPGAERLDEHRGLEKLAEASGSTVDELRSLMLGTVPADEIEFYQAVKSLQAIRKRL